MKFKKHIFVCTNQTEKKCCGENHGMSLVKELKERLSKDGLNAEIRAQRAGCISACSKGPSMVIYPEGIYYGNVQKSDLEEIYNEHIIKGNVVERLKLNFD